MSSPALTRDRTAVRTGTGTTAPTPTPHPLAPPAVAPAPARAAGRYRFDRYTGAWWWSPEMFDLYGLPPGSPQPDTETYLRFQHVEDRERLVSALSSALPSGRAFALRPASSGRTGASAPSSSWVSPRWTRREP